MKQYISEEQLNELSAEGKRRLAEWCKNLTDEPQQQLWIDGVVQLSIGQMIEFLVNTYGKRVDMSQMKDYSTKESEWHVEAKSMLYVNEELCDALWEAVKEVLNNRL